MKSEAISRPQNRRPVVSGRSYGEGRIILDGMHYVDCTFTRTTFAYYGGQVPILENCRLSSVSFAFGGPAKNTSQFLKWLIDQKVIDSL